ncbi:hypothetical protein [Rhizobium rhizogenes]|nr:hypothetical protein [Rhizobium rhizogenes]NTG71453.1 hypothetical protein [Rhizobium rhizogenes]NTG91083.1 hypothetical protein [Rhizobium rhizogenes]TRB03378.1 hypothetical protein EXN67_29070 [Rhizobium rhizogenes]TRB38120.1 hypothetical protein EXN73_28635 [Rhizobium rhizogenes]TRB53131.1 hypothetical protein EXN71_28620 [Rhizobium rhizogenes]
MGLFKLFDAYTVRARVVPALIAGLPTLAFLFLIIPWDHFNVSQAISATMAFVLLIAFADLSRHLGKKAEAKLGTRVTPELWFRDNDGVDTISKDRYRDFISTQLGVAAPTAEMEIGDPKAARQFYLSAGTWLRDHTRDQQKFRILTDELFTYGFRRNLFGLKPVALTLNLLVLVSCVVAMTVSFRVDLPALQSPGRLIIAVIAVIFHSGFMVLAVNKDFVLQASQAYGIQLILCCETLMAGVKHAPRKRLPKTAAE